MSLWGNKLSGFMMERMDHDIVKTLECDSKRRRKNIEDCASNVPFIENS